MGEQGVMRTSSETHGARRRRGMPRGWAESKQAHPVGPASSRLGCYRRLGWMRGATGGLGAADWLLGSLRRGDLGDVLDDGLDRLVVELALLEGVVGLDGPLGVEQDGDVGVLGDLVRGRA